LKAPGCINGQVLGIRPEHLDICSSTAGGWQLQAEAIEMLGAERLVYALLDNERLIIRFDESQAVPQIGCMLYAKPRADKLHQFDAVTGKRLL